MGDDGSSSTNLYLQNGEIPEFMIYDSLTGITLPASYDGEMAAFASYLTSPPGETGYTFYADCIEPEALEINYTLTGNSIELTWEAPEGIEPISYFYISDGVEEEVSSPIMIYDLN